MVNSAMFYVFWNVSYMQKNPTVHLQKCDAYVQLKAFHFLSIHGLNRCISCLLNKIKSRAYIVRI